MDNSAATLDRAIAVAISTMELSSEADGTAWFLLYRYTASAAFSRWKARRDRSDLELTINCWRVLLPSGLDPESALEYEALLAEWSDAVGSAPDDLRSM